MTSVFIKVPINESHTGKIGMFFTSSGDVYYGMCYLCSISLLWQVENLVIPSTYVTHTIEEIELPTEEEVYSESFSSDKTPNDFVKGANFILDKLKEYSNEK